MLLFSGSANRPLAEKIASILNIKLSKVNISQFSDSECQIVIEENVLDEDVFIIQPTCTPANNHILELCLMANAIASNGASSITAVMPYFGYAREATSAQTIVNMLRGAGITKILTLDLHAEIAACDIPIITTSANKLFLTHLATQNIANAVIVAPDLGGIDRARKFARQCNTDLVILEKSREQGCKIINMLGEVAGKNCIIIDDIIDTGRTIAAAAQALKSRGAQDIYAFCSHAVLSDGALARVAQSACKSITITDSIMMKQQPHPTSLQIQQLSIASLLSKQLVHQLACCGEVPAR